MALLRFIEIDGRRYLWRDCMFEGTRTVIVANFGKVCSACNSRLPRTRAWSIQQHGSPTLPPTSNNRARRRDTASHCVAITHRKPRNLELPRLQTRPRPARSSQWLWAWVANGRFVVAATPAADEITSGAACAAQSNSTLSDHQTRPMRLLRGRDQPG